MSFSLFILFMAENLMGRRLRFRCVGNIVRDLQYVVEHLPFVKEIFIEDDTFTLQKNAYALSVMH